MEIIRNHIYLAALLHDIGKFYQRADTGSVSTSKYLSQSNKVDSTFLPQYKGIYTHKHCLWTAQFIDDYNAVFKKLVSADSTDLTNKNNLLNLAACHHLQKEQLSDLGQIIKEADCLSSGMDRDSAESMKDDQDENSWDAFKKKRMISILETIRLSLDKNEQEKNDKDLAQKSDWMHLPVEKLTLSKNCFPQKQLDTLPDDYTQLWESFIGEFKFIQATDYKAFSETFLNLLYKYAGCIPASTIHFPDVSLYDHSKTTAALAVCLYDYKQSDEKESDPFLLIGADFSGIQSYIYQIVSKYAGKNLKGRSFFLRILSDAVVRYLLKELNLFQANVIYNSGGGFYLIAPNTKFVRNKLQQSIQTVEQKFFDEFGAALFVAIDSIPLSKNALMHKNGENLGAKWHELFEKRDKKKSCKFSSLIEEHYVRFFEPSMQGGDTKRDAITGEEFLPGEQKASKSELFIKENTQQQILLGEELRDTNVMIVSEHEISYWRKDLLMVNPAKLGYYYYFANSEDIKVLSSKLKSTVDNATVLRFNDEEFLWSVGGINNSFEFSFYGGNEFNGKTFEEMTDYKKSDTGFSRLGVLRMDVDNLGSIFQSGISPERATLSRYASLSRSFDYFFSGYLNTIWKETNPDKSFIIYSGGDDLFIVGRWDVTIEIAKKIRENFRNYTCENPAFSISGGIAIVSSKFPIMKGAKESADEEGKAKEHIFNGLSKNAISFMDTPLNWNEEFPLVEKLKNKLVRLIKENVLPNSFLSKIMAHTANADIKEHKITKVKTFWILTYDLSRMKERYKQTEGQRIINNCITEVCGNKSQLNGISIETTYHPLELWTFAARWAELETRINK